MPGGLSPLWASVSYEARMEPPRSKSLHIKDKGGNTAERRDRRCSVTAFLRLVQVGRGHTAPSPGAALYIMQPKVGR